MVSSNIIKEVSEQLLAEDLKVISPQQARDLKLFGPVYHGSTSDKLEKITSQGFKISVGHERSGGISHGYEISNYYGGIPAPIHHIGFGSYFTTVKSIAKKFSHENKNIGPYFLDIPNLETINFGAPRTMMKWWLENGYDYRKTSETTFESGQTSLSNIRQERLRATIHMTEFLKARYDGIWYKGKGLYKLLDGDQVVVFDPSRIYKLDKNLAQPDEIGSRVVAKVNIDPYGRGEIKVPMGTKGIIIDKKKPYERQTWFTDSEWIYSIKWDKGGIMYNVLDSWIQPYIRPTRKKLSETMDKLKESIIKRRNFWKIYENSFRNTDGHEIYELIENDLNIKYPHIFKSLEKYTHNCNPIGLLEAIKNINYPSYKADLDQILQKFYPDGKISVRRIIGYCGRKKRNKNFSSVSIFPNWGKDEEEHVVSKVIDLKDVLFAGHMAEGELIIKGSVLSENKNEKTDITYYQISKQEEQEIVDRIKKELRFRFGNQASKNFKKLKHDMKIDDISASKYDVIVYRADMGVSYYYFYIKKTDKGIGYSVSDGFKETEKWKMIKPLSENYIYKRNFWKINENNDGKPYYSINKEDEQRAISVINKNWRSKIGKTLKKEELREKVPLVSILTDVIIYSAYDHVNNKPLLFHIQKSSNSLYYYVSDTNTGNTVQDWYDVFRDQSLNENDEEHGKALQQTGYWGKQGAGAIILAKDTGHILLPYRSRNVEQPHTWGVWGGAIDEGENSAVAVKREISEEVGYNGINIELIPMYIYRDPKVGFQYSNFLAIVPKEFIPQLNWETENYRWVTYGEWPSPLHFGLKSLLQNSGNDILKEIQKVTVKPPVVKPQKSMDKLKYNAAIDVIRRTWKDMVEGGDYKNRFDYDNSFIHWMLNSESVDLLLMKYGKQFYTDTHEPSYEFQNDIEKVLEMLETKYNERRSRKINKADPLFFLKQVVRGRTWNGAKQALSALSWGSKSYRSGQITNDLAESLFNRLYRITFGETFFDVEKMHNVKRLNQFILNSNIPIEDRNFIQHYNGRQSDRFPDIVKVWRGLNSPTSKIRPGDHVTFDKGFARGYESGKYGTVVSSMIPAKDLYVTVPSVDRSEMIYWPEGHQIKTVENVPTFRQFYNQWSFP